MSTNGTTTDKGRYQRYLASREWGLLKKQVKARSGGICERCKASPSRAVHHLTYERVYNELLEDLLDVCEACHEYLGGHSNEDPLQANPPDEEPKQFSAVLTGIFTTQSQIFLFFHDEHPDLDDWNPESFFVAPIGQEAKVFSAMMGREITQETLDSLGRRFSLRSHLGRRYWVKLKKGLPSDCPVVEWFSPMKQWIYDLDIANENKIDLILNAQLFFVINAG